MAPVRWQAALDAALYLLFFIPALTIFLWVSTEYAVDSWIQGERSNLSPWLPPVYPLKTVLPVSAALLLLQGVSEFIKSIYAAKRSEERRVGKECVSTCRSRWSQDHDKNNYKQHKDKQEETNKHDKKTHININI